MSKIFRSLIVPVLILTIVASTAFSQEPNPEIFVFSITGKGTILLSSGSNISGRRGYDNQPSFGFGGKSLLFTSDRSGKGTDIFEYIFETGETKQITASTDSEYTPRAVGEDLVTFVREGAGQEMTVLNYERSTKKESAAITNKEPVAYYDWNSDGNALVWVRYASMAHFINRKEKKNMFVADHVLPSTPHNIPGTSKFSFVHRQGDDELWIKEFDPATLSVRPIVMTKDSKVDYCWLPNGTIVMGSGSRLYAFDEKNDKTWRLFADFTGFGLKEITRMDISSDGTKIAIVSNQ